MKEKNTTNTGPGVNYKPNVSVRSDKISGHGDMKMQNTKSAFSSASCTKKA